MKQLVMISKGKIKRWVLLLVYMLLAGTEAKFTSASENGSHACQRITADVEIKHLILKKQHTATPCACFEQKMALDYSFQKIGNCYKQWFSENGLKQMCCYDAYGHLVTGPKNGGYVIPDIIEPDIANIHNTCCMDVDQCRLFYKTFTSNNCSDSTDVIHATSWGDPEITTVDQHKYFFNGHGEYTFLETSDKSLQIQAQTDYLIDGNVDAIIFVAFVLVDNLKNDKITIVYNRTDEALYLFQHDGSLWKNSKQECRMPGQSPNKAFQWLCSHNAFAVLTSQKLLNISRITFTGGAFMSVIVSHQRSITGMSGLAGNLQHGDYIASNGIKVNSSNATEEQLYYYGESWRISSESENKFDYNITGGNFTYWNGKNKTVPRFFEDLAMKGDLKKLYANFTDEDITLFRNICKNYWNNHTNTHCLATIARARNESQGEAIMDTVEKEHHNYVVLHNKPPHFKNNTPPFLNVTYGVNSSVELDLQQYVADDFDKPGSMKYSVKTDIKNYTLENGRFSWMIGTNLRYSDTSLTFSVNDTLGFSAAKQMTIHYCGCESPSQCDFDSFNENSSANIMKASCKCPAYSEGLYCEVRFDPCNVYTCYSTCNGSFNRSSPEWPCADCPAGRRSLISSSNQTCENIDECKLPPSKCTGENEVCLNTEGNFSCICKPGYTKKNGFCKQTGDSTKGHMQLENVVRVSCSGTQWDISVSMDKLQSLYPGIRPQEIFFGQTNCQGTLENAILRFKQSLNMCLTTEQTSNKIVTYNNKLFYAILDPINPFLIRQHIWTFAVECDVMRSGLGSSHLHHSIETHKATAVEQYNVSVELFSDQNFMQPVTSSEHTIGVGDDIYVKVSTTLADWNIKMRLHTCYTKPFNNATQDKDVMLISDGCEVESSTHIISQSTHETKFVFQDFEYVSNDEGLYIFCNATFCDSKDYSAACVQTCSQTPTFVG